MKDHDMKKLTHEIRHHKKHRFDEFWNHICNIPFDHTDNQQKVLSLASSSNLCWIFNFLAKLKHPKTRRDEYNEIVPSKIW